MAEDVKYPPILKRTPFVGSAGNRVVHKTDRECPRAREIKPDDRWYIKEIPQDGNYNLCPFCFDKDRKVGAVRVPGTAAVSVPEKKTSFFRSLFQKKPHLTPVVEVETEEEDGLEAADVAADEKRSAGGDISGGDSVPVKKAAPKRSRAKKTAGKKGPSKKTDAGKSAKTKAVSKKGTAKKTVASKSASTADNAGAKKKSVKKAVVKKTAVKKTATKKTAPKKTATKKTASKKTAAKKKAAGKARKK